MKYWYQRAHLVPNWWWRFDRAAIKCLEITCHPIDILILIYISILMTSISFSSVVSIGSNIHVVDQSSK